MKTTYGTMYYVLGLFSDYRIAYAWPKSAPSQ